MLPSVTPQSPEAASLNKFSDYPVSNCTGIPDITIPVYEIKSGSLRLPISISYHSSGRKVYDKTGAVGLGWTLNAGGMISRAIYGDPDDNVQSINFPTPWKKASELSNKDNFRFLAGIDNHDYDNFPKYDTEYDIFSYSANGLSGNFILKDVANVKIPTLIPKKPYVIKWLDRDYCEIIDESGITYRFGKSITDGTAYLEFNSQGTCGWMLTEIVSPNKEDKIQFKYQSFRSVRKSISTIYCKNSLNPTNYETTSEEIYTSQRISEIIFKQGKIVFNLQEYSGFTPDKNLLIKNIEIKNQENISIRTIELNQSLLDNLSDGIMPTYTLSNILFKDKTLSTIEKYLFEYYPTVYPVSFTNINVRFSDYWGYYNASGKTDMCPFVPTAWDNSVIVNPNADRNTNLEAMQSGVLKKITYPTGGTTEFIFQENKYYDQETIKSCGGLRIYQIKSTDFSNNTLLKTYEYGINRCGYGYLPLIPSKETMSCSTNHWNVNPMNAASCEDCYTETLYYSDVLPIFSYVADKPVIYTEVTEYQGDETNNTGKIVYTYDRDDMTAPTLQAYGSGVVNYRLWKKSDLLTQNIYLKTNSPSNPYSLVKSITNTYTEKEYPDETIFGLRIRRLYIILPEWSDHWTSNGYTNGSTEEWYVSYYNTPIYAFGDYTFSVGKKELTKTESLEYNISGNFHTSTTNVYNLIHLLKEKKLVDSKGDSLKIQYNYPSDINTGVYNSMLNLNMINYPVEILSLKNNNVNGSSLTTYKANGSSYVPDKAFALESFAPYSSSSFNYFNGSAKDIHYGSTPELSYDDYNGSNGNIRQTTGRDGIVTSYLWDATGSYPIAQVKGVTYTQISTQDGRTSSYDSKTLWTELKSLVSNAFITTYSYKPLIGISSRTDPNGKTTYYEYDDFGRLKFTKDDQGKILKKFDYQYKQ